jgi:bifunctional ADP-heptose synthase (sugar kinase/adenylyltransferase)
VIDEDTGTGSEPDRLGRGKGLSSETPVPVSSGPLIDLPRLESLLAAFPGLSIGLVGDLFLDRYLEIDSALDEPSIETGLTAYQVTRVRNSPGALGTVINNLAALGVGRLAPVSVLGDDGPAYDLLKAIELLPVDAAHIVRDAARLTPTYTKPLVRDASGATAGSSSSDSENRRELNRLDLRSRQPLSEETLKRLLAHVDEVFATTAGLIVLDQINEEGLGVIGPAVRQHLEELAHRDPDKLIFVDSRAHIGRFTCGTLKPNAHECLAWLGRPPTDELPALVAAVEELSAKTSRPLYCTLSERGMLVVEPGGRPVHAPGYPVAGPVDIVGAGDSATAGIVAALLAGATRVEAAAVGNLVASVTVQQLGATGTASPAQVIERWREAHG